MITIHRQLKYVIFFAIGFFIGSIALASADTYTRTPSGNVTSDSYTINATFDSISNACFAMPWEPQAENYALTLYRSSDGADYVNLPLRGHWQSATNLSYSETFNGIDSRDLNYVFVDCDYGGGNISYAGVAVEQGSSGSVIFSITQYVAPTTTPTTTPTVAGAFSFVDFDDVSPTDMVASVRQGTVETTGKTLPLLIFLGIPLAFLLLIMVSKLISDTVKPEKKNSKTPWSAHGSMEHELTAFKKKERSRIKRDLP